MKAVALLLALVAAQAAAAAPFTVRVLVRDDEGALVPVPGARVAVLDAKTVISAEDALATTGHSTDEGGVVAFSERPHAGQRLLLVAGMALRAITVARIDPATFEADLVLPPEAILKIVVRDPAGRGLPAVEVTAAPEGKDDTVDFDQPGTVFFREFTDAAGRCLFYRLNAGVRYRIRVKAMGAPAATLRDVALTEEAVEIYLERGSIIRGRVIAVPGGTPVAGALVAAGEATAKTGKQGEFELTGVKPGLHVVQVTAAGRKYVEGLRIVVRPGETRSGVLLRVQGLGRLAGRLLGPDTRPAVGAEIHLRYPPLPELADDLPPGGVVRAGRSDEDGRFDFSDLLPAQGVDLIAVHPDFAPAVYYGYSILAGQSFETLILFRRGGRLAGNVISSGGVPVGEAEVWALDARDDPAGRLTGLVPLPLAARTTKTTPDGAFVLDHVVPGEKTLVVRHPDHLPLILRGVDVSDAGNREGLRLTLGRGTELRGTVLIADRTPASGAALTLTPATGAEQTASSDELGEFVFAALPAGPYRLRVTHPGHVPFVLPRLVPPVENLVVQLVKGNGIEGRVFIGDGPEPAGSALVRLFVEGPPDPLAPDIPTFSEVGRLRASPPDASFVFENTPAGRYRLEAWSPDGRFGFIDGLELLEGAAPAPVELRIRGGWGVTGVVLSEATGTPLEGARVAVVGVAGTPDPYRGVTDENGVFTIPSVAPGFHSLRAEAAGYSARIVDSVEVRRGVETMVPGILLARGSRILGSVRGTDGRPLRGMVLVLESARHRVRLTARTDEWGEFRLEDVSPGPWLLTIEQMSDARVRREQRLLSVEPGEDLQLDLRFGEGTTLTGRITRAGLPVAHSLMEVFPLGTEPLTTRQVLTATTDADGLYRVTGLPPGPTLILVRILPDSPPARFHIEVAPGSETLRNFMLPLSGIQGAVEDLDTGDPIAGAVVEIVRGVESGSTRSFRARVEADVGAARTGTDGTFLVEGLPAGTYSLVARMPGYGAVALDLVRVFAGGLTPVRVLLPPAGWVTGRVVDDAGRPVTGALVVFARSADGVEAGGAGLRTDSAGRFNADFLAPGRYTATAEARGYGRGRVAEIDVSAGGSRELEIRLTPEGRLRIQVYGPGGLAVQGARISIRDFWGHRVPFPDPPLGLLTPWKDPAVTGQDGSVMVSNLAPGIYEVHASHSANEGPPVRVRVLDGEMSRAAVTLLPRARK